MRKLSSLIASIAMSATALLSLGAGIAHAQNYPQRPVTLIHAYPGGPMDAVMHVVAERLQANWGQPVLIETRPGGNEIISADAVAKAAPDGYTIFVGSESTFFNNPYLYKSLPYDPDKDLLPVTQLFNIPFGLLISGKLPVRDIGEFVALMKREGEKHTYGSFGVGNTMHLNMEAFLQAAGVKMRHIPYRVAPQLIQDMLGGTIDAAAGSSVMATRFGKDGKMRMLAIDGDRRQSVLPDVPTFAEAGYPGIEVRAILGLAVPAGTPADVQAKIQQSFSEVIHDPAFIQKVVVPNGYEIVTSTPAEFAKSIAAIRPKMEARIRALGVQLEQ
ncbi:MAG: tripartite tricarboxylate transporter substrate binding protein [Burkholderiaceae bacterium]